MSTTERPAGEPGPEDGLDEEPAPSALEVVVGEGWKRRLPLAIVTLAPAVFLVGKIYRRTGDVGLALGAGIICPFCVYWLIGAWVDEGSRLTRSSWARWSRNHADARPLLFAAVGAVIFVGFLALLFLLGPLVTSY